MARVVQRRNNPPYLLIVFVFLFVVATAMAVVLYLKNDELSQKMDKESKLLAKLANNQQISSADVQGVVNNPQPDNTVVGELNKQVSDLTQIITGIACTTDNARKQADEAVKALGSTALRGLVFEVRDLKAQKDKLNADLASLTGQLNTVQKERDAQLKTMQSQKEAFDAAAAQLTQENKKLAESNETYQKDQQAKINEMKAEQQAVVDGLNKSIADLTKKNTDLQWKNQQLDMRIAGMIREFRIKTTPQIDVDKLAKTPKGKLLEVVNQVAYINLGSKDRVVPGLSFAVYPSTGIPDDGKFKATVVVTNVSDHTSECRVKDMKLTNPVLPGDLIGNVAYDPLRTYTFVVRGDFDLHGTGKASRQGYEEVKDMILRSGGKVVDDVSVKTDFLVMGDEPARPPKLDESATPSDIAVNAAQAKANEEYNKSKRQAGELYVPVLNSNRFLALMGYTPEKSR